MAYIEESAVPHSQNQGLTNLKSAKLPQFNVKVRKMGYVELGPEFLVRRFCVGELELDSNMKLPIAVAHDAMKFTGGLGVIYSRTEGDHIGSIWRDRGRGEIGFSYSLDDNVRIDFESFYEG